MRVPAFRRLLALALCAWPLAFPSAVLAQEAGSPAIDTGKKNDAPQPLPLRGPTPSAPPAIPVPNAAPPEPGPMLSTGPRFLLKSVRVEGSTILTEDDIDAIAGPFVGKQASANELEEIRRLLTIAYIKRGYVNSGAVLPDQQVTDGQVVYRIVEGKLTRVSVKGVEHFSPGYFERRFSRAAEPPLDVNALNREVRILLQDPAIERLNVDLEPDLKPGEAHLDASVVEAKPWTVTLSMANDTPPAIGPIHGQISGTYRNLLGWDDTLSASYGRTGSLNDGSAAWSVPVTEADTLLSLHYDNNDSVVSEQIFKSLNITSQTETIGIGVDQPLYRTGDESLGVGLVLDYRSSETFLLDHLFPLTPGSVDGKTKALVLRFTQNWLRRTPVDAIAVRSTFSFGLPALNATNLPSRPNADFQVWLGQFQYVRQIFKDEQLVFRLNAQLSDSPLFSFEQIAVGGAYTVRGYRENELVRDNAVIASIEDQIPVAHPSIFGLDGTVELVPFADFGNAWNTAGPTPTPHDIESVGLSVRLSLGSLVQLKVDYGHALRPIHNTEHDLQDSGVHFQLAMQY